MHSESLGVSLYSEGALKELDLLISAIGSNALLLSVLCELKPKTEPDVVLGILANYEGIFNEVACLSFG